MKYGITGNPNKDLLWKPVADLIGWFLEEGLDFALLSRIAEGLVDRDLIAADVARQAAVTDLGQGCDIVLSFGGDGTLLNTARVLGSSDTPILGVNIGRLGFLTRVEVDDIQEAIRAIEEGLYETEKRLALEAHIEGHADILRALNEILITRTGSAQMISIEVEVDGTFLNRYWADGLIVATSTGSTAYSLSVGGPIIAPGSGVVVVTPVGPHTLTVRPIILADDSEIVVRVKTPEASYAVAADGSGPTLDQADVPVTIRRSARGVQLVKLPDQDYFDTLRRKLGWGVVRGTLSDE